MSSLKALKVKRKSEKAAFALVIEKVAEEIENDDFHFINAQILLSQFNDKFNRLNVTQESILEFMKEHEYEAEFNAIEADRDLYLASKVKLEHKIDSYKSKVTDQAGVLPQNLESTDKNRKFKLPKLELKKFSGEARDFLGFWSQFSKIHEDPNLAEEDKFQYLSQCIVPNSRAAQLIESFPLTAKNYPKAVDQLKERFGREELLVQIYVRDLLSLVMKNATSGRCSSDLTILYDNIESKLRALESLGRTKEKFADFLGPLVESCLPENILRAWERSRVSEQGMAKSSERSLDNLMTFLRHEVESDELIKLAQTGFSNKIVKQSNKNYNRDNFDIPTGAMLVSTNNECKGKVTFVCIFCERPHSSAKCFTAQKMNLNEKKIIVQKKRACFACLKIGHFKSQCKANIKCMNCNSASHVSLMCNQNINDIQYKQSDVKPEVSLSNNSTSTNDNVFLQTLYVNILAKGKKKEN